jgi:hypothetical protein
VTGAHAEPLPILLLTPQSVGRPENESPDYQAFP